MLKVEEDLDKRLDIREELTGERVDFSAQFFVASSAFGSGPRERKLFVFTMKCASITGMKFD